MNACYIVGSLGPVFLVISPSVFFVLFTAARGPGNDTVCLSTTYKVFLPGLWSRSYVQGVKSPRVEIQSLEDLGRENHCT